MENRKRSTSGLFSYNPAHQPTLDKIKDELENSIFKEIRTGRYPIEINAFFNSMSSILRSSTNQDELEKIIIGGITLVLAAMDLQSDFSRWGIPNTHINKSKYTETKHQIVEAAKNDDLLALVCGYPHNGISDASIKSALLNIANFVLKDPRGCDDIGYTYHLKDNTFIRSMSVWPSPAATPSEFVPSTEELSTSNVEGKPGQSVSSASM